MGDCSTNCNPCGPSYDAINQLAVQSAVYARQAKTSATDAQNSWLEFNALYLGAFASAPTVDNEGNPLQVGALYWNLVSNTMFVWDGTNWIENGNFDEFTNFMLPSVIPIPAANLRQGQEYEIAVVGNTNWTAIGAASATVGVRFTKNAVAATGTGTARVTRDLVTRLADVVNVKDFGAVGDGVADDSSAIQAALNAVHLTYPNGSGLYFPSGTYLINTTCSVGSADNGDIILYGDKTILKTTNTTIQGVIKFQGPTPTNRGGRVKFRGISIEGIAKTDANIGLLVQDIQGVDIEDCTIRFFGKGIRTYNVDILNISHKNYISFCGTGIECDGPSGGQANTHNIIGNLVNQCTLGIEYKGGFGATIAFNEIDNNDTHIRIGYDASTPVDAKGTNIVYNKFESASGTTPKTIVLGGAAGIATSPYVAHNTILHSNTETIFTVANMQGNGRIKNNRIDPQSPGDTKTLITQTSSATKAVFSETDLMPSGTIIFNAPDATQTVTLSVEEPDTNYNILLTLSGVTGTPSSGAFTIVDMNRTTTGFTARIQTAPGVGNAVAYVWQLVR